MKKALSLILAVMMLLSLMVPAYADDAQTATGKGTGIDGEVIVEANSLEVDGITGATVSSTAIKAAVTEALTAMGFDPASYQGAAAAERARKSVG